MIVEHSANTSILVLCVDRDNDVGTVLNIKTPLIGENELLRAATEYILVRPEDSDSNAMFAAIQTLRELRKQYGSNVEVALIAGLESEDVEADMKILRELDQVLSQKKFDGVVLVSDGPTDELVAPLIQSRLPIFSIRRVIVQQSRGVEETFVLLINYIKKALTEEKYKRYSLGLTGLFLVFYSVLSAFAPQFVWPIIIISLGSFMFIKGYNVGEYFSKIYRSRPVTFATYLLAITISFLAFTQGIYALLRTNVPDILWALGYFLLAPVGAQLLVLDLFILALLLPILGTLIDNAIIGKPSSYSDVLIIGTTLLSRQLVFEVGRFISGSGDIRNVLTWAFIVLGSVIVSIIVRTIEKREKHE
jgi:putative membrane protein